MRAPTRERLACAAYCVLANIATAVFVVCTFGTEWLA